MTAQFSNYSVLEFTEVDAAVGDRVLVLENESAKTHQVIALCREEAIFSALHKGLQVIGAGMVIDKWDDHQFFVAYMHINSTVSPMDAAMEKPHE